MNIDQLYTKIYTGTSLQGPPQWMYVSFDVAGLPIPVPIKLYRMQLYCAPSRYTDIRPDDWLVECNHEPIEMEFHKFANSSVEDIMIGEILMLLVRDCQELDHHEFKSVTDSDNEREA